MIAVKLNIISEQSLLRVKIVLRQNAFWNNSNDNLSFWKIFQLDIGSQSKKMSGYIYGFVYVCVYVTKYLFNVTFIACDIEQKTLLYLFLRFCYLLFCCHWYISPLLYLFNKKSFCFSTFVIAYRSKELRNCSRMFLFKQIKYTSSLLQEKNLSMKIAEQINYKCFCS